MSMKGLNRNVPLLTLAAALSMSINTLIAATAALVGNNLAMDKSFATLPVAMMFAATMCTSIPAGMLMQRIGRKASFLWSSLAGIAGGALATFAIVQHSFWLFVLATICIGVFCGFANFYRFAAADTVDVPYKGKAVSMVMVGGIVAAIVGPNLARLTRTSIEGAEFAGAYVVAVVLYGLVLLTLAFLQLGENVGARGSLRHSRDASRRSDATAEGANPDHRDWIPASAGMTPVQARSLSVIVAQPKYLIALVCGLFGYCVMTFVMTATPLAMQGHAFHFDATSSVIQWHVVAMFAPSFVTGTLIARFGVATVMGTGAVIGIVCLGVNLAGATYTHYLAALMLLGLSWNFLFVGSTTLLTETYTPAEKNKAQAFNDFIVFTAVALASLSAGALQNRYGWELVNVGALPLLCAALAGALWLLAHDRRSRSAGLTPA
ncbi:MAG: MFS transporter [Pseudomonadota bacterium]|nr:MFS transporter [Pseudomonadota bacterium]